MTVAPLASACGVGILKKVGHFANPGVAHKCPLWLFMYHICGRGSGALKKDAHLANRAGVLEKDTLLVNPGISPKCPRSRD